MGPGERSACAGALQMREALPVSEAVAFPEHEGATQLKGRNNHGKVQGEETRSEAPERSGRAQWLAIGS